MKSRRHVPFVFFCLGVFIQALAPRGAVFAGEAGEEGAEKPAKEHFKIEMRKGVPIVGIQKTGDAVLGDCFEVRRGKRLVGYAHVASMDGPWPQIRYLIGRGRQGDELVPVSLPVPDVQLFIDERDARVAKELKALLGDKLFVERLDLGEKITIHKQCTVRIVIIHAGVFFMMGDPIAQPFAREGGTVIVDSLAYSHLKGDIADETLFKEPPTVRIVHEGKLTAGFPLESHIPWYGKRRKKFVARYWRGIPQKETMRLIATDGSSENTAILEEDMGGRMLVLDLISLNGRAGRDPGSKNKLIFVAQALGTGPRYARYIPSKPEFDDVMEWFGSLVEDNPDRVRKVFEGGGSEKEEFVFGFEIGPKDKPLVVLVGCFEGNEWLCAAALNRLLEVLLDNPGGDYKIEWLLQRLRIKIIPILNVWGYRNDSPLDKSKCELNRNFPYHWDKHPDKTARGGQPFSEPETKIIQRLVEEEKAVALLELDVDHYDAGYRMVRARDAKLKQRVLLRSLRTILNARLRHRFVVDGDKPLQLRLTRDKERPSAINWAASKGVLAASLKICGDGEDSLVNNDVAIEGCLAFLYATALSLEKPEPEPQPPPPKKRARTIRRRVKRKVRK